VEVALQVVEGDEKRTWCLRYNWTTLSLGYINTKTWSSRLGIGCKADNLALNKIIVAKSIDVKANAVCIIMFYIVVPY
jgi:hypothetical protein